MHRLPEVILSNLTKVALVGLFFTSSLVQAEITEKEATQASDINWQALAQSKQWQHLLHYRDHLLRLNPRSQNDSSDFFLAREGKTDLLAELTADYQAFARLNEAPDQSAQCRFPARYHWLKSKLGEGHFADQPCPELDKWTAEMAAHSLTLIFPASHINSPSSMYGHTLVRMDRQDQKRSKLLAYAVNFAANADPTDNELVFSYKGLSGGYPGVVSIMPYYVKANEYQHMEYRDVWEYELSFTPEEVAQFVRHVWETKETYFDYFFFDENCSYRLLALLDAASERSDLANDFFLKAVPVDTIRSLQKRGLVSRSHYQPSAATALEYKSLQVSQEVLQLAKDLVDSEQPIVSLLAGKSDRDQVRALELAHAYARYLAIKKKESSPVLRQRTLDILSARSRLTADSDFTPVPMPEVRDDQGHLTQRGQIALGRSDDRNFADLEWRIAYHDVLDLPQGFVPGSQIQMGILRGRYWQDDAFKLQEFKLVDVLSLSHRTFFQRPTAWAVSFGMERFSGIDSELYGYLKIAFGKSYLFSLGRFYGMAEANILGDNQFDQGYQASLGPRLGWLIQNTHWQSHLRLGWQPLVTGDNPIRRYADWNMGYRLSGNLQFRMGVSRQLVRSAAINEGSASLVWYF